MGSMSCVAVMRAVFKQGLGDPSSLWFNEYQERGPSLSLHIYTHTDHARVKYPCPQETVVHLKLLDVWLLHGR